MTDLKQYQPSAEQLEAGKRYEFSRNGENWFAGVFCGMYKGYYVADELWVYIRECQATLGKVKPKPVELIDGEYYLFDYNKGSYAGKYNNSTKCFYVVDSLAYSIKNCTNIRRLKVVE